MPLTKSCTQCSVEFEVTEAETDFFDAFTPTIPPPDSCPDCRSRNRAIFRNERILHKRTCDLCKMGIVSIYHAETTFPVYCPSCFFSANWDPYAFGLSYDRNVSFLQQIEKLYEKAPRLSVMNKNCENSEYGNYVFANKNCYLLSGSHYNEDCLYGVASTRNRDCIDFMRLLDCELCYECKICNGCHNCIGLWHSTDCNNCLFSRALTGCSNCLFCSNLRHKEYHVFNKPVSKEEFETTLSNLQLHTYDGYTQAEKMYISKVQRGFPVRAVYQVQCEDCTGDDLQKCSALHHCYSSEESEDCTYGFQITAGYNLVDCDYIGYDRTEWCYQSIGCTALVHSMVCNACWHGNDMYYSQYCHSCRDCIGCIGLHQSSNCILNTQYPPEEYDELRSIIFAELASAGVWGNFFPKHMTSFGYDETVAQEWFPLSEKEAKNSGYTWFGNKENIGEVQKVIPAEKLPQSIDDIPDDILNWGLKCPVTNKLFKLTKKELHFYRTRRLPVPRIFPEERHRMRMRQRSPRHLWKRHCAKCSKDIQTTYSPERPEIVYCEECYLKEVY